MVPPPTCEKLDTLEMAGRVGGGWAGAKNWENCTQKITTITPQITTITLLLLLINDCLRPGAASAGGRRSARAALLSMRYLFRCATSSDALPLSMRHIFLAPPPVRPRVFKSVTFDVTFDVTLEIC